MTRQELADIGYDDVVLLDPEYLDVAIDSISHDRRLIYDYDKLVEAFMKNNDWSEDEAIERIEYNTIRSLTYVTNSPIIKYRFEE